MVGQDHRVRSTYDDVCEIGAFLPRAPEKRLFEYDICSLTTLYQARGFTALPRKKSEACLRSELF